MGGSHNYVEFGGEIFAMGRGNRYGEKVLGGFNKKEIFPYDAEQGSRSGKEEGWLRANVEMGGFHIFWRSRIWCNCQAYEREEDVSDRLGGEGG